MAAGATGETDPKPGGAAWEVDHDTESAAVSRIRPGENRSELP